MVVHCENFLWHVPIVEIPGSVHDQIQYLSCLFMGKVFLGNLRSPARVDQVIETGPGNVFFFKKIKNLRYILDISFVDGKPHPHFDAGFLAVVNAFHCTFERSFDTPKLVMCFFNTIQADAHIGQTNLL